MPGYTKLFHTIVTSTIWQEDAETKVLWVTMLALADKNGEVQASIPGLARMAGVSLEATEIALKKFQEPDAYSRSKTDEGRRITSIPGGWELINHAKYRAMADLEDIKAQDTERKRRQRERESALSQNVTQSHKLSRKVTKCHALSQNVTLCHKLSRKVTKCHALSQNVTQTQNVTQSHDPVTQSHDIAPSPSPSSSNKQQLPSPAQIPEVLKPYESAINDWIAYKREKGQSYKPRGLQALYAECTKLGPKLPAAIQNSMAKNYAGIYEARDWGDDDRSTWWRNGKNNNHHEGTAAEFEEQGRKEDAIRARGERVTLDSIAREP